MLTNDVQRGLLAGLLAASIWGGMYVVSKVVLEVIPPITLVAVRMGVAFVCMVLWLRLLGRDWRLPRKLWAPVAAMGLVGYALSITAQFIGTGLAGAALGSLITTASPLVTVALSALLRIERVPVRAWVGLGIALLGVWVLSGSGNTNLAGVFWLIVAALTWGILGLIGGQTVRQHDPALVSAWASLIGGVALAVLVPGELARMPIGEIHLGTVAGVLYLGVVSTAVAFTLWVYAVAKAGSVLSGIAFFAQPVVGGLLGWALLGESLGLSFLLGAVLLFVGALIARPS
ncbi:MULTISPECIES: DMT family transporter [unclassified Meiothermus]|uniref:DMT family transporter n=1 Tax=unclassified Meiothermus TaxID=370471 RepID=UPI001F2D2EC3|nr:MULTISPECIES: DMT family transporter [unclassified Meiothermus]